MLPVFCKGASANVRRGHVGYLVRELTYSQTLVLPAREDGREPVAADKQQ
jgi:hypothetical protein